MKYQNSIIRLVSVSLAIMGGCALQSCGLDEAANIPLVELGAPQKEYIVEADAAEVEIPVYSNGKYHIETITGADWIALSTLKGENDGTITVEVSFNEEFKRREGIIFCSDVDARRDTVYIKQKGQIEALLKMENTSVILPGAGGASTAAVTTNVPFEYMKVVTNYTDEANAGWISDLTIEEDPRGGSNCTFVVTTDANPEEVSPRTASVDVSFTDGWGDKVQILLNLVQRNSKEGLGRELSFEEFLAEYSTGKPITDYVLVEGIVVSNRASYNAGENEQTTTSAIDYSVCEKTVYLESLDGRHGVNFLTLTEDDNVFAQFDKVQILLNGVTLTMKENPERYEAKGLAKSMVVSQVKGSKSDVPVKEKYLNELTDADIYTYVTLKDVEFPIRKGSICPVNEGYSLGTNAHRLAKYPLLVRDINGDVSYMITNTKCVYRSNGRRTPYGSGKISGVIVHERFSRYEWREGADPLDMEDDPTLGYIGRYQIRHQCEDDVYSQMNDSVENSFSALLTEYRFWNPDVAAEVCRPTYGENGWLTHTYQVKYTGNEAKDYTQATYKQHMWGGGTYDYLGPIGNNVNYWFGANYGNKNGVGIVLDPTKEHYNSSMEKLVSFNPDGTIEWCGPYASDTQYVGCGTGGWTSNESISTSSNQINYSGSTSMRGKGNCSGNCYLSFASHFWWDDDTERPYSWLINFSTEGISTSHLSMQLYVLNSQQTWYAPRFWKAEWSETDSQAPEDDDKWHLIGEYTVPDVSVWANTLYSSIVAYKPINFDLPLELLGKKDVYVRLSPANDLCSDGSEYANTTIGAHANGALYAAHASNLSYFAIRYNK